MRVNADRVVVLGANGTMGAGASEVFAAAGFQVTMLARDLAKAEAGLESAQSMAKAEGVTELVTLGTYDADLPSAVAQAKIIFEALPEDLNIKREYFARVDQHRSPDSIVASVSSGLSMAEMAQGMSESFRRHFLGIHLYNPPHALVGAEVIANPETDPKIVDWVMEMLAKRLLRKVIVANDVPAFAGNRVGFKVLNEAAQLAQEHGVAFIDYIIGPYTGRALSPLSTIDLVGWDVHKAIVDNVYEKSTDEAHSLFHLPDYMNKFIAEGRLGNKTPKLGGFYRRDGKIRQALDPATGEYQQSKVAPVEFIEQMKGLNRLGKYTQAMGVLAEARGFEADLVRRVIIGYISYALNRVGEVAKTTTDIDTIMNFGFNWTPPSVLADLIGARRTIELMDAAGLKVPAVLEQAARKGERLYQGSTQEYTRTLAG